MTVKKYSYSCGFRYINIIIINFIEEYYSNPLLPDAAADINLNDMVLGQDNLMYPIPPWTAETPYFYPKQQNKRGNE